MLNTAPALPAATPNTRRLGKQSRRCEEVLAEALAIESILIMWWEVAELSSNSYASTRTDAWMRVFQRCFGAHSFALATGKDEAVETFFIAGMVALERATMEIGK